jgi:natural resistance-associated macrophage protein
MIEIAIIGADMQEVIGTAIAFTLLSSGKIPLWAGVLITVVDTLSFLFLDKFGFRKLEFFFCLLIAIMGFTFGTEYVILAPNQGQVLEGVFVPQCQNCSVDVFLQAVSIIGAVIMPHNLYLHSALVKTRKVDRTKTSSISKANMYFFLESSLALLCSFIINLFVVSVFGQSLAGKTSADARQVCMDNNDPMYTVFENTTDLVDVNIYKGGVFLGCAFGAAAMYIWAVGILAAGQSSTMAGCYAGQYVMEGFLNMRWARWKRVLFTRSVAIIPTLLVAIFQDIQNLSTMNDLLNALQMMQLPFALIPVLTFTSSEAVMSNFRTGILFRIFLSLIGFLAICINLFFLYDFIIVKAPPVWPVFLGVAIFTLLYFAFVLYLTFYCVIAMIGKSRLLRCVRCVFPVKDHLSITFPWLDEEKESSAVDHTRIAHVPDWTIDPIGASMTMTDSNTYAASNKRFCLHSANCCEDCKQRNRDAVKF